MNISDLLKLDIKDLQKIDYKKLVEELRKRPDALINIVVVLITAIIFFNLTSSHQKESKKLKRDIKKLTEKVEEIDRFNKAQQELDSFLDTLPGALPEDEFVNTLTDLAVKRNIQIESFSPTNTKSTPFSDTITIELNLSLDSYKNLWLFIHDIENSQYALKINNWQGYMTQVYSQQNQFISRQQKPAKAVINSRISLSTVKIKHD